MLAAWKLAAVTLLLSLAVAFHGQGNEAWPSLPYKKLKSLSSPLNGNWHLTGVNSNRFGEWRLPFLSFAIEVDGTDIHGQGSIRAACQNPSRMAGGSEEFTGKIAPDGTFEANGSSRKIRFSVHGTVPAPGETNWQGTYEMKNLSAESDCILDESGAFTATKYAPFTGTYSGNFTDNTDNHSGKAISVTVEVTQGEPGSYAYLGYRIPLGGQITVLGVPCFSRGTATYTRTNDIRGDQFWLTFSTEDGALVHLNGNRFLEDSSESTITDVSLLVEGGRCDGLLRAGTLTRQ